MALLKFFVLLCVCILMIMEVMALLGVIKMSSDKSEEPEDNKGREIKILVKIEKSDNDKKESCDKKESGGQVSA